MHNTVDKLSLRSSRGSAAAVQVPLGRLSRKREELGFTRRGLQELVQSTDLQGPPQTGASLASPPAITKSLWLEGTSEDHLAQPEII